MSLIALVERWAAGELGAADERRGEAVGAIALRAAGGGQPERQREPGGEASWGGARSGHPPSVPGPRRAGQFLSRLCYTARVSEPAPPSEEPNVAPAGPGGPGASGGGGPGATRGATAEEALAGSAQPTSGAAAEEALAGSAEPSPTSADPSPTSADPSSAPGAFAVWRKRLSPLVLVIAMAFLLREACEGNARRPVTVQLDLGAQSSRVRRLWVDVFVDGESVAQYQRGALAGTPSLEARLSGEPAELRIELELAPLEPGGELSRRVITRKLSAKGGSTVSIPLGDELAR